MSLYQNSDIHDQKLYIKTYGCMTNVYDSNLMENILSAHGYKVTDKMEEANLVILNTCHIREKATEKLYSELGRIKEVSSYNEKHFQRPKTNIIVAGCVGQAEGEEIFNRAPFVDIIVGPQSYHTLPDMLSRLKRKEKRLINLDFIEEAKFDLLPENIIAKGPSSPISIQEGCDKFCTFCVVPYTRGEEFSRPMSKIYREALALSHSGAKEIILTGQNVNAYHGLGEDGKECSLSDLIRYIAKIDSIERIRYVTSHPKDMNEDLIRIHAEEKKLMPFLHLPIQSGSDRILKLMNRKHTRAEYLEVISKLKNARPDLEFSSDIIVGFPGESDADFEDSLDIVKAVGYIQCYSFKYSPRPGTPAALKEQIPEHIKDERLQKLQKLLASQQIAFNESFIGKTLPVLFEKNGKFSGQIMGKSPYMQSVYIESDKNLIGQILNVRIESANQGGLGGSLEI